MLTMAPPDCGNSGASAWAEQQRRAKVDSNHAIEGLGGDLCEGQIELDAGIVDEDIDLELQMPSYLLGHRLQSQPDQPDRPRQNSRQERACHCAWPAPLRQARSHCNRLSNRRAPRACRCSAMARPIPCAAPGDYGDQTCKFIFHSGFSLPHRAELRFSLHARVFKKHQLGTQWILQVDIQSRPHQLPARRLAVRRASVLKVQAVTASPHSVRPAQSDARSRRELCRGMHRPRPRPASGPSTP